MELIVEHVWDELRRYWVNGPRFVAVAYYSSDENLKYELGDVLIVNASDTAIRTGQTNASALRRAHSSGARVFSHPNLHAKLYALGSHLLVGSANSSLNSRHGVIDCLGHSDDPYTVSRARSFVDGLGSVSDEVDDHFLTRIEAFPVESKQYTPMPRRPPPDASPPHCWLLGMHPADYPGDESELSDDIEATEGTLEKGETAEWFWWPKSNSRFYREAKIGDLFVTIWRQRPDKEVARGVKVYMPRIIQRITIAENDKRRVYHFAEGDVADARALTWRQFLRLASQVGWEQQITVKSARAIPQQHVQSLCKFWPIK